MKLPTVALEILLRAKGSSESSVLGEITVELGVEVREYPHSTKGASVIVTASHSELALAKTLREIADKIDPPKTVATSEWLADSIQMRREIAGLVTDKQTLLRELDAHRAQINKLRAGGSIAPEAARVVRPADQSTQTGNICRAIEGLGAISIANASRILDGLTSLVAVTERRDLARAMTMRSGELIDLAVQEEGQRP